MDRTMNIVDSNEQERKIIIDSWTQEWEEVEQKWISTINEFESETLSKLKSENIKTEQIKRETKKNKIMVNQYKNEVEITDKLNRLNRINTRKPNFSRI